jgi:hypothetical protein
MFPYIILHLYTVGSMATLKCSAILKALNKFELLFLKAVALMATLKALVRFNGKVVLHMYIINDEG